MKNKTVLKLSLLGLACAGLMYSCKKDLKTNPAAANPAFNMEANDMVSTPYGLVPRSKVFEVDNKTVVKVVNGHLQALDAATGRMIKDFGALSKEDLLADKTNPYVYAAKLRSQSGNMESLNALPFAALTKSAAPGTNYTGYYLGDDGISNIQTFSTNWIVPNKPIDTTNITTTFLWNGLSGGAIQPVLQWDQGQGPNYTIANWYFTAGSYFHGTFVKVEPGTNLQGLITFVSNPNDTTWNYKESFVGYPAADVNIVRNSEATGLSECYEPYTALMSAWPNQPYEAMTNINLTLRSGTAPDTLHWIGYNDGPVTTPTGYNSVVVNNSASNGEVRFYFGDGTGITPDSSYQINSALAAGKVLGVAAGGTRVELNTLITPNNPSQGWKFVAVGGGYYKILPLNAPGKALDVAGAGTTAGTQVKIYADNGGKAEKWMITPSNNGYFKLSPACAPSLVMEVTGAGTADGTGIQLNTSSTAKAQKFKFTTAQSTYQIFSAVGKNKVLDVTAGGTTNGTLVELYSRNVPTSPNQTWRFVSTGDGYYKILPLNAPGEAMDVANGSSAAGTQIKLYADHGGNAEKWKLTPTGDGYYNLSPACAPGMVLEVKDNSNTYGAKIQLNIPGTGTGQKFKLNAAVVSN